MRNEITIDAQGFKQALDTVKGLVPAKPSLPIYTDVLLDYNKEHNSFTLTASNGDSYITIDVTDCVHMLRLDDKEGWAPICISHTDLRNAFSLLPEARRCVVTVNQTAGTITVDYQDGNFTLPIIGGEEFPPAKDVITNKSPEYISAIEQCNGKSEEEANAIKAQLPAIPVATFSTEAQPLLEAIAQAKTCVANEELRQVMNCVALDCFIDKIVVVATDGQRLYKKVIETGGQYLQYMGFGADRSSVLMLPRTVLSAFVSAFAKAESITVKVDTHRAEISTDKVTMNILLQEGSYPNYQSVIPGNSSYRIEADRRTLIMALRRVALFSSQSTSLVKMSFEKSGLTLSTDDIDFSKQGKEVVPLQTTDAFMTEKFEIGVKITILLALLDLIGDDSVVLYFDNPSSPMLLRPEDANKQNLTLLLMPMLLNS